MTWRKKSFFVLGVGLCFGVVLVFQMGFYLANVFWGTSCHLNIFKFCIEIFKKGSIEHDIALFLVNTYVVFTIFALFKKIIQQVANTIRMKKKIALLINWEKTYELNQRFMRSRRIFVIDSDERVALTLGFRSPAILLSTNLVDMLDKTELEAVILHETAHQNYQHTLKIFVLKIISEVMWYIPLTKWAYKNFKILVELEADEYAITRMGTEIGLGSALVKLIKTTHLDQQAHSLLVPFADGIIDYRLKQLIEPYYALPFKIQIKSILISVKVMILLMILMISV